MRQKLSENFRRMSAIYPNTTVSMPSYVNTLVKGNSSFLQLRKLLSIRCILSLSQAFLNNTELKIFGCHLELNPGPLA